MPALLSTQVVTDLLDIWEREFNITQDIQSLLNKHYEFEGEDYQLIKILEKIAEVVEMETEAWYKMDPDPFDDRHPGRADPNCALGHVMKILFKNDNFMNKLVNSYLIGRESFLSGLRVVSSRLLLDIMPGLETSAIFQDNESLIHNLIEWCQLEEEPLSSYSIGLLGSAMELQDVASIFRDNNSTLVPLKLDKLNRLKETMQSEYSVPTSSHDKRHFKDVGKNKNNIKTPTSSSTFSSSSFSKTSMPPSNSFSPLSETSSSTQTFSTPTLSVSSKTPKSSSKRKKQKTGEGSDNEDEKKRSNKKPKLQPNHPPANNSCDKNLDGASPEEISGILKEKLLSMEEENKNKTSSESIKSLINIGSNSNSCWAELEPLVIGRFCMNPLSTEMKQRLILHYLQPMGEYQDLLPYVFERPIMSLLFFYIDLQQNNDVRLAFEALKYLAALLCHKRFALEFIQQGGIQKLLQVKRPSVAATGVSMCLYYLSYFDDLLERVCLLPNPVVNELVTFALWLLECSHESGRVHATMFFALSFSYRIVVEVFDQQDGLRKLFNVMSTLPIFNLENQDSMTEDELFTNRQSARHVTVAIRRYLEAHLSMKGDQIKRMNSRVSEGSSMENIGNKAVKFSSESIQENIELLIEHFSFKNNWKPVNDLLKLGAMQTLINLLIISSDWTPYTGKVETLRSALDIISICCITKKAKQALINQGRQNDDQFIPAITALLNLASKDENKEPEVQKAALNVLINSVCDPLSKNVPSSKSGTNLKRRSSISASDEFPYKMWQAVRSNNGIMVLLQLLTIKVPVSEADSIRALACKALVGLARCDTVKQIISKLPMVTNGQLQQLMWEPILQDKRNEHMKFCKHALSLIEMVSGKLSTSTSVNPSLDRLRRADIVAQTNVAFNSRELLQLIHDHLIKEGLKKSALILEQEALFSKNSLNFQPFILNNQTGSQEASISDRPSINNNNSNEEINQRSEEELKTSGSNRASVISNFIVPLQSLTSESSNVSSTKSSSDEIQQMRPFSAFHLSSFLNQPRHLQINNTSVSLSENFHNSSIKTSQNPSLSSSTVPINLEVVSNSSSSTLNVTTQNITSTTSVVPINNNNNNSNNLININNNTNISSKISLEGSKKNEKMAVSFIKQPTSSSISPSFLLHSSTSGSNYKFNKKLIAPPSSLLSPSSSSTPNNPLPVAESSSNTNNFIKQINFSKQNFSVHSSNSSTPATSSLSLSSLIPVPQQSNFSSDLVNELHDLTSHKGSSYIKSINKFNDLTASSDRKEPPSSSSSLLSSIVTSYLKHQHANCEYPVVTCPPFSLLSPHVCPEPKHRLRAPTSIVSRMMRAQTHPRYGGYDGAMMNRKYIFSKFRPAKTYRTVDDGGMGSFSCCSFSADEKYLYLGLYTGELKVFNVETTEEVAMHSCHRSLLHHCQPSLDDKLLLTSSWGNFGAPSSALWKVSSSLDRVHTFEADHVEFSKQSQDKIIGTKNRVANIYDTGSGRCLMTLFDAFKANHYNHNTATFNPTDELVLNDGVLWDVNSSKPIHKFDKFNVNISGVFHPNGLEVIINSQVWDVRTYHLLHTVESLDQCQIKFNKTGTIIYGAMCHLEEDDLLETNIVRNSFSSSFRTLDSSNYDNITTFDVKKKIFGICPDSSDHYLAVIEKQKTSTDDLLEEIICRLYEIGRIKGDQAEEEDENHEDEEGEDGEDDDDDDEEDDLVEEADLEDLYSDSDRNGEGHDDAEDVLDLESDPSWDNEEAEEDFDQEEEDELSEDSEDSLDERNDRDGRSSDSSSTRDDNNDDDNSDDVLYELSDLSNL